MCSNECQRRLVFYCRDYAVTAPLQEVCCPVHRDEFFTSECPAVGGKFWIQLLLLLLECSELTSWCTTIASRALIGEAGLPLSFWLSLAAKHCTSLFANACRSGCSS